MFQFRKSAFKKCKTEEFNVYSQLQADLFGIQLDFANLSVSAITEYLSQAKKTIQATYDYVAHVDYLSFYTVVQPFINLSVALEAVSALITMPKDLHPDPLVREASAAASIEMERFTIQQQQREDVYKTFSKYIYHSHPNKLFLNDEEIRFINDMQIDFKRNGMELPNSVDREQVMQIRQRIAELSVQFGSNLNEVNTKFEFTREELSGLPEEWFSEERKNANGTYTVMLEYSDYAAVLDYVHNREVRKQLYIAFNSRCKEQNTPICLELLQLRQKLAALLGYASYVDYAAEKKMVKNSKTISAFLEDMNKNFDDPQRANFMDLQACASEIYNDPNLELQQYDMRYLIKIREKELCNVDHEIIRKYFPTKTVVAGTLQIFQDFLGLKFLKKQQANAWADDVLYYEVYDAETTELLGGFYLDLEYRQGKTSNFAVFTLIRGSDVSEFLQRSNSRRGHQLVMTCNFPRDATLTFEDVVTFFHEFGHLMHGVCTRVQLPCNNGLNVPRDFVEAPSQMLESWCFDQNVLARLSEHKDTGAIIPKEYICNILKTDMLHSGYQNKRQLSFAFFDYKAHMLTADELAALDVNEFWLEIQKNISALPMCDNSFPTTFEHLFALDYAASFYGYMYADVIAKDLFFSKFIDDPLNKIIGSIYRKLVLEPGNSRDPEILLESFLEAPFSNFAFLLHYNASVPKLKLERQQAAIHLSL